MAKNSNKNNNQKLPISSFPVNDETNTMEIKNNPENYNEEKLISNIISESSKSAAKDLASTVFYDMMGKIENPFLSIPLKTIGLLGSIIRGNKKSPREMIEESIDPNLNNDRNQSAGGATIVASILGFLATNQLIVYITKPLKWIGIGKTLGLLAAPLMWLNQICTPPGIPTSKILISYSISKGVFTLSLAQGLAIFIASIFNMFTISIIAYTIIMIGTHIIEQYRIREVIQRNLKKSRQSKVHSIGKIWSWNKVKIEHKQITMLIYFNKIVKL